MTLRGSTLHPADRAWVVLAIGVIVYEAGAQPGELLSEAMDRYRKHHPVLTSSTIVYLAMHLLRLWPKRFDPLHRLAVGLRTK